MNVLLCAAHQKLLCNSAHVHCHVNLEWENPNLIVVGQ